MLKRLLRGKPLGHPLHPILVHFPIGLFLLSFIFDVASFAAAGWVRPAYYAMALGVMTALLAAMPGVVEYSDIRRDHPARKTATYHMIINIGVVLLYIVNLVIRGSRLHEPGVGAVPFVISLVAIAALSYSGYLGGVLVYDQGIGVGRHRHVGKMPRETITRTGADARDGYVTIIDNAELANNQSLRAEVNGVVMAIAKVDGNVYAFQEFCTHRYGPLSEGCFYQDGQVKCPWHGSCFEMRTGKVTQGPAKREIPTYAVIVRDGKVMVRVPEA